MRTLPALATLAALAAVAALPLAHRSARADGAVTAAAVEYLHGDVTCRGHLAKPAQLPAGGAPAVLVIHDWMGCGDFAKQRAASLAAEGYVALALDMYGAGKIASGPDEARALATAFYKDPALMVARAKAGLDTLRKVEGVDGTRIAVIGFCFGGSVGLQLARSGEDVAGVVSFHGGLKSAAPATAEGAVKAKVLVLHGGADPFVPSADVAAFMDEMNQVKASWRMETYGGAVHAFTNPAAGTDPSKGAAYDADADARSKKAQDAFFAELFAKK